MKAWRYYNDVSLLFLRMATRTGEGSEWWGPYEWNYDHTKRYHHTDHPYIVPESVILHGSKRCWFRNSDSRLEICLSDHWKKGCRVGP